VGLSINYFYPNTSGNIRPGGGPPASNPVFVLLKYIKLCVLCDPCGEFSYISLYVLCGEKIRTVIHGN
jgi:hypothetical protein